MTYRIVCSGTSQSSKTNKDIFLYSSCGSVFSLHSHTLKLGEKQTCKNYIFVLFLDFVNNTSTGIDKI